MSSIAAAVHRGSILNFFDGKSKVNLYFQGYPKIRRNSFLRGHALDLQGCSAAKEVYRISFNINRGGLFYFLGHFFIYSIGKMNHVKLKMEIVNVAEKTSNREEKSDEVMDESMVRTVII